MNAHADDSRKGHLPPPHPAPASPQSSFNHQHTPRTSQLRYVKKLKTYTCSTHTHSSHRVTGLHKAVPATTTPRACQLGYVKPLEMYKLIHLYSFAYPICFTHYPALPVLHALVTHLTSTSTHTHTRTHTHSPVTVTVFQTPVHTCCTRSNCGMTGNSKHMSSTHTHTHTQTHTYTHLFAVLTHQPQLRTRTHTNTYTHSHTHTYTPSHTHTHTFLQC